MDSIPHTAVVSVIVEIFCKKPTTGELSGLPVHSRKKMVCVEGKNKEECVKKLEDLLARIKNE